MIHLVNLQVVVEDLTDLLNVWDVTGLKLRPHRDVVQSDLEGSSRQEVSLHHVAEEERHETGEDLVVLTPGPGSRSLDAEEEEGVLTTDDEEDGEELQVGDQLTHTPVEGGGRVVLPLNADVRVQLSDGVRVVLEDFTVTSGDTVLEPEHRAAVEGRLGGLPGLCLRGGEAGAVGR